MNQKGNNPITVHQLISYGSKILASHKKENANIDAELLALYVLGYTKLDRILNANLQVLDHHVNIYKECLSKRCHGMPLQYIIKEQEFMGLSFYVDPNVLIPRQDTETLVEVLIEKSKKTPFNTIIEIGVGSGCISISLAKFLPYANITGIDISTKALEIAKKNAKQNQVENRIKWVRSDILKDHKVDKNINLIVSNPPYIPSKDYNELTKDIKEYEPILALDGGSDGLKFYREITKQAREYLIQGGMLAYEIGYNQGRDVSRILEEEGFIDIEVIRDLAHKERIVLGILG